MSQIGLDLKERGMEQAKSAHDVQTWKQQVVEAVQQLADNGWAFTSEDVLSYVGLPRLEVGTNANNAVGAMMNGMAKRGIIQKTSERRKSRRPSSHGAEIAVWVGAAKSVSA